MTLLERRALRLANFRPRQFWLGTASWMLFFVYPLLPGWLLKVAYNELRSERLSAKFLLCGAGMILAEIAMAIVLWRGHATYMRGFEAGHALVRANALDAQLASGGPTMGTRMLSPGDAVARFRDDPTDLLMLVDNWVDVVGALVYALVAVGVLSAIDPLAALAAIVPLIAIGLLNRVAGNQIRKVRSRARSMSSDTTDFLASAFGGSLTVKVSGAMPGVLRRIDELNAKRSRAMVSDQTWSNALWSVNTAAVDICVGLALLVASRRNLETGEIALFAAYTIQLIWLPQKVGGLVVGRRRFEVAAKRLDELLPSPMTGELANDRLSQHRSLPVLGGFAMPTRVLRPREPLERLEVRGLSVTSRGLTDVSFAVARGTITAVSGPVGSGKSTLLRALIGLVPIDEGQVLWNGRMVEDRAAFFVPRTARTCRKFLTCSPRPCSTTFCSGRRVTSAKHCVWPRSTTTCAPCQTDTTRLSAREGCGCREGRRSVLRRLGRWSTVVNWSCSTTSRARSISIRKSRCGTGWLRRRPRSSLSRTGPSPSIGRIR